MFKFDRETLRKILQLLLLLVSAGTGTVAVTNRGCPGSPTIPPPTAPSMPAPVGPCRDPGTFDKIKSVVRIAFGNAGCSATVIYPQLPDGRVLLLTASHCVEGQPKTGIALDRDGRRFGVHVVSNDPESDHAWLISDKPECGLHYTYLSDEDPKPGDSVYHCGFGVDKPGNVEAGTVVNPSVNATKVEYRISVSSGDSGGAIAFNQNGHVISPVCCTTNRNAVGRVFGCKPSIARSTRPTTRVLNEEWEPLPIPLIEAPQQMPAP